MESLATEISSEVGLVGHLFENCLDLYSELLKIARSSNVISTIQGRQLHRELERFLLWGHGFNSARGDLDLILERSPDLRLLTLSLLKAVSRTLCKSMQIRVRIPTKYDC